MSKKEGVVQHSLPTGTYKRILAEPDHVHQTNGLEARYICLPDGLRLLEGGDKVSFADTHGNDSATVWVVLCPECGDTVIMAKFDG